MKFYLVFLIGFFSFSCKKKEIEFIPSKVIDNVYFVENLPVNDSVLKGKIEGFINNNRKNKGGIYFYRYTSNTRYFLNHKEESTNMLDDYPEDELASFIITRCETDTTKLVGNFIFYGLRGAEKNIFKAKRDTIIYECK